MDKILHRLRGESQDGAREDSGVGMDIPTGLLKARALIEAIHSEKENGNETTATG